MKRLLLILILCAIASQTCAAANDLAGAAQLSMHGFSVKDPDRFGEV